LTALERLVASTTLLIVVDVQERLCRAMDAEALGLMVRSARILVESARALGAPVVFTEQYPKGLGPTLPSVAELLERAQARRFEKTAFSACGADEFVEALDPGLAAAVVIGMEAHVCVYQTVRDLCERDLEVHVPIDGVLSRRADHRDAGLSLIERAGGIRTTSESVVFDWLGDAGRPEFKALAPLFR
jgi:nicotinamidase-related amidase